MSDSTGTLSTWLIGAGCAVVIVVGAFAISGNHGDTGSTAGGPATPVSASTAATSPSAPTPTATPTGSPSAALSSAAPTPKTSAAGVTSTPPSASPSQASTPVASPSLVPSQHPASAIPTGVLGSFSYATTGYEQTNIPGTKRTYPSTTTFANTRDGDCVKSTWTPDSQHVQSQVLCANDNTVRIAADDQTISFFGISSTESFSCGDDAYLYQPGVKAGQVWNYKCTSSDATATQAAQVIGYQTMTIGGTAVRVLHVHLVTTVTGAETGTSTQDYWIGTRTPLLAKETGTVDASQKGIHYQESYSLTLESTTPKT